MEMFSGFNRVDYKFLLSRCHCNLYNYFFLHFEIEVTSMASSAHVAHDVIFINGK